MEKLQTVSTVVVVLTLAVMIINVFFVPLADWIVRIDGIVMIIGFIIVYYTRRRNRQKNR